MLPFDYMNKIPASTLSNSPQSDVFPTMVKISSNPIVTDYKNPTDKQPAIKTEKKSYDTALAVGLATLGGFALGRGTAQIIERPIDNFPAGLIGASVCGLGILSAVGFYIATYGGFFDKDRDFKTMFKNL